MHILRTPDSRFENLPDWPYPSHYSDITDASTGQVLRMACRFPTLVPITPEHGSVCPEDVAAVIEGFAARSQA
jgi:hypothetical protein